MATITKNCKVKSSFLKTDIRRLVIETVQGVLKDPDFGLELQDWVKRRLKKIPKKTIPFEKIKEKYQ